MQRMPLVAKDQQWRLSPKSVAIHVSVTFINTINSEPNLYVEHVYFMVCDTGRFQHFPKLFATSSLNKVNAT